MTAEPKKSSSRRTNKTVSKAAILGSKKHTPHSHLLSIGQAAKYLSISPDTLRNWEDKRRIVPVRSKGGIRKYKLSQLKDLLKPQSPLPYKHTLSIGQASKYLGVSIGTLRNWEKSRKLIPSRGKKTIRRYSLIQLKAFNSFNKKPFPLTRIYPQNLNHTPKARKFTREFLYKPGFTQAITLNPLFINPLLIQRVRVFSVTALVVTLLLTGIIVTGYLVKPEQTKHLFASKSANQQVLGVESTSSINTSPLDNLTQLPAALLAPFNSLAQTTIQTAQPDLAKELGFYRKSTEERFDKLDKSYEENTNLVVGKLDNIANLVTQDLASASSRIATVATGQKEFEEKVAQRITTKDAFVGKAIIDSGGNIYPAETTVQKSLSSTPPSLGTWDHRFYGIFANNFDVTPQGNVKVLGTTTLGGQRSDYVKILGAIASDLIPQSNDSSTLGSSDTYFKSGYVSSVVGKDLNYQTVTAGTLSVSGTTTITGDLTFNDLTASRAVFTDSSKALTSSATSAVLVNSISDETGSGLLVFATSPSLTTPNIGAAIATSINSLTITTSTGTLTIPNSKTISFADAFTTSGAYPLTLTTTGTTDVTLPTTGTLATLDGTETFTNKTLTSPKLNEDVALTSTSTKLNYITSAGGTTGTTTTNIVFSTSPSLTTPTVNTSLTVTDDDWIGLGSAAGQIVFDDQATDFVNILNANVGIGTTAPQYKVSLGATGDQIGYYSDSTHYGNIELYNTTTGAMNFNNYHASAGGFGFTHDGTNLVTILSGGNVGIGTTNPGVALEVAGADDPQIKIRRTQAGGNNTGFTLISNGNGDDINYRSLSMGLALPASGTAAGYAYFNIANGAAEGDGTVTAMTIKTDGNVGLGTTNPASKLDVSGTVTATAFSGPLTGAVTGNASTATALAADPSDCGANSYAISIAVSGNLTCSQPAASNLSNGTTGTGSVALGTVPDFTNGLVVTATSGPYMQLYQTDWGYTKILQNGPYLEFYNQIDHASAGINFYSCNGYPVTPCTATNRLAILNNGNVGIGDTTPDYLLDVAGTAGFDSTLTMTGSTANIALGSNYLSGDGGDEGVYVDSSGNVGIGTTNPGAQLVINVPTSGTYFQMTTTQGASVYRNWQLATNDDVAGAFNLKVSASDGVAPSVAVLTALLSGSVGIGTTSPAGRLHIKSSGDSTYPLYVQNSNSQPLFGIWQASTGGLLELRDSDGNADVSISAYGSSSFMGGSVGIGDATPQGALEISQGDAAAVVFNTVLSNQLNNTAGTGYGVGIKFVQTTDYNRAAAIAAVNDSAWGSDNALVFYTNAAQSAPTAKMRITGGGDVCSVGGVDSDLSTCTSDARLKTNIQSYELGLNELMRLRTVRYNWNNEATEILGYDPNIPIVGFIAQDIQSVIPEWVSEGEKGYLKIDGVGDLRYMLVNAIQEQQAEISSLQSSVVSLQTEQEALLTRISDLEADVAGIATSSASPLDDLVAEASTSSATTFSSLEISESLRTMDATISGTFRAFGDSFLSNTIIAGDLIVDGTLSLNGDSISSIDTLYLQSNPLSTLIDIFAGKVQIDNSGKVSMQKLAVSSDVLGTSTIPAGQNLIVVSSDQVTTKSKILVTPQTPTGKQSLIVSQKEVGVGFTVSLEEVYTSDITFDWFIVDNR